MKVVWCPVDILQSLEGCHSIVKLRGKTFQLQCDVYNWTMGTRIQSSSESVSKSGVDELDYGHGPSSASRSLAKKRGNDHQAEKLDLNDPTYGS